MALLSLACVLVDEEDVVIVVVVVSLWGSRFALAGWSCRRVRVFDKDGDSVGVTVVFPDDVHVPPLWYLSPSGR